MFMSIRYHKGEKPDICTLDKSASAIKRIYKQHDSEQIPLDMRANIMVFSSAVDGLKIRQCGGGGFVVEWLNLYKIPQYSKRYWRFANAVNAMGKKSAELQRKEV